MVCLRLWRQPVSRLDSFERWDSFAVVEFMSMADEKLGVQLEPAQIAACCQVSDLAETFSVYVEEDYVVVDV